MRRNRLWLIAAATVVAVLGSATAAYAVWSTSASASSTASTATVGATHGLTGSSLAVTYTASVTSAVGVVTVTNTGTRDGTYTVNISATSASPTLRPAVTVELGTAASCTTSATLSNSTVGTFGATLSKSGAIAAGASVVLCLRTSMSSANIIANPSATLAATVASSVLVGTWTATASPAITFSQAVTASAAIDSTAWYWVKKSGSPERCAEADNYGTTSGTAVSTGSCGIASQASSNLNEYWRFTPTTGGYFRIINRNAQTLGWSVPSAAALQPLQISSATGTTQEWLPVDNGDGTFSFKLRANTALCAEVSGNGNGALMRINTCSTNTDQRFGLVMFNTVNPTPITLTCSADGWTANYSWPQLTGYESEVTYRVLVGATVDAVHTGATGFDPTARFAWDVTTAAYPVGVYTLTVQQSVAGGSWNTTGTGTLRVAAAAPYLNCS
jgi:hypothetical protein